MFLVRVQFVGSSNLCFDNLVVHRGVRVCQFGSVLDRVVSLSMTCSRGRYIRLRLVRVVCWIF